MSAGGGSSQFGNIGHKTGVSTSGDGHDGGNGGGENGIMLFGVRVTEGEASFRKSVSMNNLSLYDQTQDSNADVADGYESDDVVHASGRSRERKRGVPWTEDEHRLFLLGLQKVGKGDWRGISRNFVKTRTPTQVASHAQKYFLRRNNQNRRRRRSSLFDITTDTFMGSSMEEDQVVHHQEGVALTLPQPPQPHLSSNLGGYRMPTYPVTLTPAALPLTGDNCTEKLTLGPSSSDRPRLSARLIRPTPILPVPPSSKMADLNLSQKSPKEDNQEDPLPLSLKLPTPSSSAADTEQRSPPSAAHSSSSAFEAMSSGDNIISVA